MKTRLTAISTLLAVPWGLSLALFLSAGGLPASGPADEHAASPGARLISGLGSESWDEREGAELGLLEEGLRAAPLLEEAARSENLELAYRARYLLARIDPQVTELQVIKLQSGLHRGDGARVVEVASASGLEGQNLIARPPSGDPDMASFALQFRSAGPPADRGPEDTPASRLGGGGRIEVRISPAHQGSMNLEVKRELAFPASIAILKRSEECLYERRGLEITRERHPYVTILRARQGRSSLLEKKPYPIKKEDVLEEILRDLEEQAGSPDRGTRGAAIDLLGELGAPHPFENALRDPEVRDAAALASGRPDLLLDLIAREGAADDAPGRDDRHISVRAAAKLLDAGEAGEAAGLDFLLKTLVEADPSKLHLVIASLADHAARGKLSPDERERFLRTVLSDEVLGHAPWEDVEAEYFFSTAIGLLDPGSTEDRALALAVLERLERLARGELGPVPVRLRTCLELWRRAARKAPGSGGLETDMLLRVLPSLNGAAAFSEAVLLIEEGILRKGPTAGPGEEGAEQLDRLLSILVEQMNGGEPGLMNVSFQSLIRLARSLPAAPGQLRPLAAALLAAVEAAGRDPGSTGAGVSRNPPFTTAHVRQAEEILSQWSSISKPPQGPSRAARESGRSAEWRAWLEDPARVAGRESELLLARAPSKEGEEGRLVYYEFDIVLDDSRTSGDRGAGCRVLDGRRVELTPSRPVLYSDRWGNEVHLRIDPEGQTSSPPPQGPGKGVNGGGRPVRYRVSSRPTLFAGIPVLTSVQGRELSATWHETSNLFPASVALQKTGVPAYRSLVLLLPGQEDSPTPPPAFDGPEALWGWFLKHRLLDLPEDAPPQRVSAVIGVLRALKVREGAPLVRRLFDRSPSADLARQLHETGDEAGLRYLLGELKAPAEDARIRAAVTLLEIGRGEGFVAFEEGTEKQIQTLKRMHFQVLNAIDAYLKHSRADAEGKEKALGFLFGHLEDAAFQPRAFAIIQREIGNDFGYGSARGIDDQERRGAALEEAVRAAREHWRERTAGR